MKRDLHYSTVPMLFHVVVFRRSAAALFAGLVTLQLVLAGGVAACVTWEHGAHEASATATAASVPSATSATHHRQSVRTTVLNGATDTDEAPCGHPVSSGQCRSSAWCAAGFLPAAPNAEAPAALDTEAIVGALVAMPRSVSFPPERRPPRT